MEPKASVVLVNYNGYKDTVDCLKSLSRVDYDNFDVIVVDNASTELPTKDEMAYIKSQALFLPVQHNLGFSGGNNIGIEQAIKNGAAYVLLLNNDTTVEPDFLKNMVEAAKNGRDVGIVTGKIRFFSRPDYIWFGGGYFDNRDGKIGHERYNIKDNEQFNSPVRNISFASGCLMLIPIGAVQKVGLLEEKYFLYSEDTDYCCRIRKAGLNILFCEKAVIYHKVSASTGKNSDSMTYYTTRNKLYIARDFTTNRYSAYARITLQLLKDVIRGRKRLSPIVGGYRSFFKNEVGMMPKN